ncbi:Protein of unknown function [Friedmanniella luteola]|uniref:Chorismate lyase n=1 Tax=Friedmanniella luteola TaxID=546871 RepID=A0A1H1YF43_9ACTN|nr:chorismate pyruvate-lyase family protein [Friedmanniella luteola]SDT19879.1 Protein of unknown function [Friedmanniella luteola]
MTSRAARLDDRQHARRRPERPASGGASDAVPGLGRVEQLVLRGDGLTTTSLEILTGERIDVVVDGNWPVIVPDGDEPRQPVSSLAFAEEDGPDLDGYVTAAVTDLGARPGTRLLVREVLLRGTSGRVHGGAEVVALHDALPPAVVTALATTAQPIGRLLRDHEVPVLRELHRWGFLAAGPRADRLDADLRPTSRVLGRTYLMRSAGSGRPLATLTERFCPHVFAAGPADR